MKEKNIRWLLVAPLYFSLCSIFSYGLSFFNIPLNRWAFGVFNLLFILGLIRKIKQINLKLIGIMLVPVVITWLMLFMGFRNYITPPNNHDASDHYFMIERILTTGSLKYANIFRGYDRPSWYMFGLHSVIVNWLRTFGLTDLNKWIFPFIWIIVAIYPLSIYYLSWSVTKHHLTSWLAAIISATFAMFPTNVLQWGGWTYILGIIMLYFCLGQLIQLLRTKSLSDALILGLLIMGMMMAHTSELLWFLILSLPTLIYYRKQFKELITNPKMWGIGCLNLLVVSLFWANGSSRIANQTNPQQFLHTGYIQAINVITYLQIYLNQNYFLTALSIIGIFKIFKSKRYQIILPSFFLILIFWFLRISSSILDGINRRLFPLFEPDRIYALLGGYWSLITAITLIMLTGYLNRRNMLTGSKLKNYLLIALLIAGCVWPYLENIKNLHHFLDTDTTVTKNDVILMRRNQNQCSTYLNDDYADAGKWVPFFTSSQVILGGSTELMVDHDQRTALLPMVNEPRQIKELCQGEAQFKFDCIYIGGKDTRKAVKVMQANLAIANPNLIKVDQVGQSYIFKPNCH